MVQVDLSTLPKNIELLSCEENSRFGEHRIPSSWTFRAAPFGVWISHVGLKPFPAPAMCLQLRSVLKSGGSDTQTVEYSIPVHVGDIPLNNLRLTVILPDGAVYQQGNSRLDAAPRDNPSAMESVVTYKLDDVPSGLGKERSG